VKIEQQIKEGAIKKLAESAEKVCSQTLSLSLSLSHTHTHTRTYERARHLPRNSKALKYKESGRQGTVAHKEDSGHKSLHMLADYFFSVCAQERLRELLKKRLNPKP